MLRSIPVLLIASVAAGVSAAQDLSGMAAGVLKQTGLARQAIAAGNQSAALDHVKQAAILAGEIQRQAPPREAPLLVPVSIETTTTTTYAPVKKGTQVLTARRMKKHTSVREVRSESVEQALDVGTAAKDLETAQAALQNDDLKAADSALLAVQQDAVRSESNVDLPLARARKNLEMARTRVEEHKYNATVAPLRAAAVALADYQKLTPAPHARDAETMRLEIEQYAARVSHDHDNAVERIDRWLMPLNQW